MYSNIPKELQELKQWVCWRFEEVGGRVTKVPYTPFRQSKADVLNPDKWGTFEQATAAANSGSYNGIGFVFTAADPYCGIDIDDKDTDPATPEEREVHARILEGFNSYTERSPGGRGYHVIIRGRVDGGRDRGHVGVYSQLRYFTMTGDVVRAAPIADCQQLLDALVGGMPKHAMVQLEEHEALMSDAQLHDMALRARNGDKYDALTRGEWASLGYPSQSEADFALLSILAFYTRSNEQVRRIFRCTPLGKRDKAMRNDNHLNRCLAKIRAEEPSAVDLEAIAEDARKMAMANWRGAPPAPVGDDDAHTPRQDIHISPAGAPPAPVGSQVPPPPRAPALQAGSGAGQQAAGDCYPPGLVGQVAHYIYSSSIRPVKEVALTSAIGLIAGIAGRCYNVSSTGLNQYLLFVAKTGTGKEDGPKGIERLLAALRPLIPSVDDFIGPGAFASGQALIRVLDQRPSFVCLLGEFGLTLQALNDPRAPAATLMLKRVLLDLYSKSGWNNVLRSTAYSDAEKNTRTIFAPNVSFVGDTTPETFFDSLSTADISDGLIPRLHIVEYKGQRPSRNRKAGAKPDKALVDTLANLVTTSLNMANNNACQPVALDPVAQRMMDAFDEECDDHMRRETHNVVIQLWNRAHLKALKIAALVAVGCDVHQPTINERIAQWAIDFTRAGTEVMLKRFETGDIGSGEGKQAVELRRVVEVYFGLNEQTLRNYKVKPELRKSGIIPYSYLSVRTSRLACFQKDRRGPARALRDTLEQAVETEVLGIVPKPQAAERFGKKELLYYRGDNW